MPASPPGRRSSRLFLPSNRRGVASGLCQRTYLQQYTELAGESEELRHEKQGAPRHLSRRQCHVRLVESWTREVG